MSGRGLRVIARIVLCVCGLASFVTAAPFAILRGIGLPYQSEWVIFVVGLGVVGALTIAVGVMPRRWLASWCKLGSDDTRIYSSFVKICTGFALIGYLMAVFAYFVPQGWNLNPQVMLGLCPLYLVRMTFDPSVPLVLFLLAPLNAAAYGSLGVAIGYVSLAIRARPKN